MPSQEVLLTHAATPFSATALDAEGELLIASFTTGQIFKLYCPAIPVAIDVAPYREPNIVSGVGRGLTAVAVLGAPDFDAADVDTSTLRFGPGGAPPASGWPGFLWDVNRDGWPDRVTFFRARDIGLQPGDSEACLSGETAEARIEGCDAVQVRPPQPPGRHD